MKPEINFMIHDWMHKKLMLKGPRLLVCAYLFSARKGSEKYRTARELYQNLPIGKRTVFKALEFLITEKIVIYKTITKDDYPVRHYRFEEEFVFNKVFNNVLKN